MVAINRVLLINEWILPWKVSTGLYLDKGVLNAQVRFP